ncbi:MAG: hypothetical protein HY074_14865 [Deltaproteobacteria bacterium]|nr:hypothetical protein [Deltaproteobacteria bacterium]
MSKIKFVLPLAALFVVSFSFAEDVATKKADRQEIDTACTADAATAGCGGEVVGKGLLKCLHGYKKAHKDFKFSDGCKAAMKQARADKAK